MSAGLVGGAVWLDMMLARPPHCCTQCRGGRADPVLDMMLDMMLGRPPQCWT